jgi:hypothetical protein
MQNNRARANPHIIFNHDPKIIFWPLLGVGYTFHEPPDYISPMIPTTNCHLWAKHHVIADSNSCPCSYQRRSHSKVNVIADGDCMVRIRSVWIEMKVATMTRKHSAKEYYPHMSPQIRNDPNNHWTSPVSHLCAPFRRTNSSAS